MRITDVKASLHKIPIEDPPRPNRGMVTLTEEPGLGLEPRWEALQEYEEK